jgi:hypothetical protein
MQFFKKYHKWLGVVLTLFILFFSLSGLVLNHRKTLSAIDINRKYLPKDYKYGNWNNAAVNATCKLSADSILVYGNIGIWLTDSSFSNFKDFNAGFPKGIDNRKIAKLIQSSDKQLFAATFFGLYKYNGASEKWLEVQLPVNENRIVDLLAVQDTLYVMTRSFLLKSTDYANFTPIAIPEPENYDHKTGLFKTLWVIHSGEIYGIVGKLLVDLVGIIFIVLSLTGLLYFINGYRIKAKAKKFINANKIKSLNKSYLNWHNKIGWLTVIFLIITTITGMFLRPPLLIAIGNARVGKIPHTELATANAWFDLLRRIAYDDENKRFIVSTMDGFYYSDDNFKSKLKKFISQPPASIMGVTVLEKTDSTAWLVGSFEGLFTWNPQSGYIYDYIKKQKYIAPVKMGPPVGDYKVSGYTTDFKGAEIYFDYDKGAQSISLITFP